MACDAAPRFPLLFKMHGHAECRYIADISAWQQCWQQEHRYWHPDDLLIDSEGRCYSFDSQSDLAFHLRTPHPLGLTAATQITSQLSSSSATSAIEKDTDDVATTAAPPLSSHQVTQLVQAHFFAQNNSCVSKIRARSIAELISFLADSD